MPSSPVPVSLSSRAATAAGFGAIGLWGLLALFTAASGTVPPFQLTAMTFAIGGAIGLAVVAFRPGGIALLAQPPKVWLHGVAGSSAITRSISPPCASPPRRRRTSSTISGRCSSSCSRRCCLATA